MSVTTYKVRSGNPLPGAGGNIIFVFGTETQEIENNDCSSEVKTSKDMCLLGGDYFSANYKAYPGSFGSELVFSETLAKKPIATNEYSGNGPVAGRK